MQAGKGHSLDAYARATDRIMDRMKYFTLFFNIKYCNVKPPCNGEYDYETGTYAKNPWMNINYAIHRHLFWNIWYKID
jgi:hypothetical protein